MKEVKSLFLVFIAILIISMAGIFAYGTSDPATFGHSLEELETCGDGQIIQVSSGEWVCATPADLDFNGLNLISSGNTPLEIRSTGGGTPYIDFSNDGSSDYDMRLRLVGNDDLLFEGGDVGIGTTNPQSSLSVGGNGYSNAGVYAYGSSYGVYAQGGSGGLYADGGSGYGAYLIANFGAAAWGSYYDFYAGGPGTDYGASSSIRWKENIVEIDNALDKVLALEGVYFDWNGVNNQTGHDMGMIAEDVGEIVPEVVQYEDRTNISNYYVEDGERKLYANGMDYGALTPMLVEAIKELKSQNDDLRTELCSKDNSYSWCN